MTTFDARERAFEAKFAHDAEMRFRVEARCLRLLALWAAGILQAEAETYAAALGRAALTDPGAGLRQLVADLAGRASAAEIRAQEALFQAQARAEVLGQG